MTSEENGEDFREDDYLELFLEAARFGDYQQVHDFYFQYSNKPLLQARDESQNTPLHLAAANGKLEVVKFLVSQGADVNAQNAVGNTPLHWAALLGESQVVQFLIDQGADPCILNDFQKTPLDEAASKGHQSIVSLLEKLLESQGRADTSWLNQ